MPNVLNALTEIQQKILDYIKAYYDQNARAPSYREIQAHFGFKAIGTIQDHLRALKKKGALETGEPKDRRARSLLPIGKKVPGILRIPIYGEIAAGSTRDSPQLEIGTLAIPDSKRRHPCFGLRVVGDSMTGVGIFEGDHLIVEKRSMPRSGEIVVALLDGETTVKRFEKRKGGEVFLVAENPKYQPMATRGRRLEIQGVVVGLQRWL